MHDDARDPPAPALAAAAVAVAALAGTCTNDGRNDATGPAFGGVKKNQTGGRYCMRMSFIVDDRMA